MFTRKIRIKFKIIFAIIGLAFKLIVIIWIDINLRL